MSWQPLPPPAVLAVGSQVIWIPLLVQRGQKYQLRGIAGHGFIVDTWPPPGQPALARVLLWAHFGVDLDSPDATLVATSELFAWQGVAPALVTAEIAAWQTRSDWRLVSGSASSFSSVVTSTLGLSAPAPEATPLSNAMTNEQPFRTPTPEELAERLTALNFPRSLWRKP